jgi:hypothetical protein
VIVIPVANGINNYAQKVADACFDAGLYVETDLGENTLNKKIRNAEIAQFNFIFGNLFYLNIFEGLCVLKKINLYFFFFNSFYHISCWC